MGLPCETTFSEFVAFLVEVSTLFPSTLPYEHYNWVVGLASSLTYHNEHTLSHVVVCLRCARWMATAQPLYTLFEPLVSGYVHFGVCRVTRSRQWVLQLDHVGAGTWTNFVFNLPPGYLCLFPHGTSKRTLRGAFFWDHLFRFLPLICRGGIEGDCTGPRAPNQRSGLWKG